MTTFNETSTVRIDGTLYDIEYTVHFDDMWYHKTSDIEYQEYITSINGVPIEWITEPEQKRIGRAFDENVTQMIREKFCLAA
jgi:hypothetical protein